MNKALFNRGVKAIGGDKIPDEMERKIDKLLNEFVCIVEDISKKHGYTRDMIRSLLPCEGLILLDAKNIFIAATPHFGVPYILYRYKPKMALSQQQVLKIAREVGLEDPFLITIPASSLEQSEEERRASLEAIALTHVKSEVQRCMKMTSLIQIKPLFGDASYSVDEQLVFILMPFTEELDKIYGNIIKPTVASLELVCRRADDFKTNNAVIKNIWKAICEARIIIADLTGSNPNVMYELGIAHLLVKRLF